MTEAQMHTAIFGVLLEAVEEVVELTDFSIRGKLCLLIQAGVAPGAPQRQLFSPQPEGGKANFMVPPKTSALVVGTV